MFILCATGVKEGQDRLPLIILVRLGNWTSTCALEQTKARKVKGGKGGTL